MESGQCAVTRRRRRGYGHPRRVPSECTTFSFPLPPPAHPLPQLLASLRQHSAGAIRFIVPMGSLIHSVPAHPDTRPPCIQSRRRDRDPRPGLVRQDPSALPHPLVLSRPRLSHSRHRDRRRRLRHRCILRHSAFSPPSPLTYIPSAVQHSRPTGKRPAVSRTLALISSDIPHPTRRLDRESPGIPLIPHAKPRNSRPRYRLDQHFLLG